MDPPSRAMVFLGPLAFTIGSLVTVLGVIFVVVVQGSRANVDTAQMTGKMLKIAEEQLRITKSQQSLGDRPHARLTTAPAPKEEEEPSPEPEPVAKKEPVPEPAKPIEPSKPVEPAKQVAPPSKTYAMRQLVREVIRHNKGEIKRTDDGFFIEDKRFETLADAQTHLDATPLSNRSKA